MFLKNKTLVVLVVISLYIAGVFLSYSGDLLNQIQKMRYENQIRKINLSQTLLFSSEEWLAFPDKTEIKYNNAYYDVISFQKMNSKVIVKVVKDELESKFRLMIAQLFNKHKEPPFSEKKDNFLYKDFLQNHNINIGFKIYFLIDIIENHKIQFNLKTNSFIDLLFDPPC